MVGWLGGEQGHSWLDAMDVVVGFPGNGHARKDQVTKDDCQQAAIRAECLCFGFLARICEWQRAVEILVKGRPAAQIALGGARARRAAPGDSSVLWALQYVDDGRWHRHHVLPWHSQVHVRRMDSDEVSVTIEVQDGLADGAGTMHRGARLSYRLVHDDGPLHSNYVLVTATISRDRPEDSAGRLPRTAARPSPAKPDWSAVSEERTGR